MSPLQIASYFGECSKIHALLLAGVDVNEQNEFRRTALHYACGRVEVEEILVIAGAAWDIVDIYGNAVGDATDNRGNSNSSRFNSMRSHHHLTSTLNPGVPTVSALASAL